MDFPLPTKNLIPAPANKASDDDLWCELYSQLRQNQREAIAERFGFMIVFSALYSVLCGVAIIPFFKTGGVGNAAIDGYILCLMAAAAILVVVMIKMERALQIREKQAEYIIRLKGRQNPVVSIYPDPLFPAVDEQWMDRFPLAKLFILYFTLHFFFLLYLLMTYLGNSFFPDMSYSPFAAIASIVLLVIVARKLWKLDEGKGLESLDTLPAPKGIAAEKESAQAAGSPKSDKEPVPAPGWGELINPKSEESLPPAIPRPAGF